MGFEPEGYTLYAYGAVQVWAQAAKKAGSLQLQAMVASLRQHQFDTVLGPIAFDERAISRFNAPYGMSGRAEVLAAGAERGQRIVKAKGEGVSYTGRSKPTRRGCMPGPTLPPRPADRGHRVPDGDASVRSCRPADRADPSALAGLAARHGACRIGPAPWPPDARRRRPERARRFGVGRRISGAGR